MARLAVLTLFLGLCAAPVLAVDHALDALPFSKKLALAKAGDPEAKVAVAEAYESGAGVNASPVDAAKWYREAALAGILDAQFHLAKMIDRGAAGVKQDKATAIKLFEAAAKKGHALSANEYGIKLQKGDGVAKDEKAAFEWYRKAADKNLPEAQNNLAVMYLNGWGTQRSLEEAFHWLSKASDQHYIYALNNLGGMYEKGWGTPKDQAKALELYKQAAAQNLEIAKKNLERLSAVATAPAQ